MHFLKNFSHFDSIKNALTVAFKSASSRARAMPREYKSAILASLAIYASYRAYHLADNYLRKKYAQRLARQFSVDAQQWDANGGHVSGLNELKRRFLFRRINQLSKKSPALNLVELGYCGSNFKHLPIGSFITICNCLDEFEPYLRGQFLKYAKHLWLYNESLNNKLIYLRSNSVDVVFSTHYLCTVDDLDNLLKQVHRVLKPVS
jgi:SAM-dependent methyltransferase